MNSNWLHASPRAGLSRRSASSSAAFAGRIFLAMHEPEPIHPGPGVTQHEPRSAATSPSSPGGPGDTPVFVLEGQEPGGTLVLLGGTHPQEVAGMVAAILVVENVRVRKGRVVVVPQANRSGFTYTEPLEGFPAPVRDRDPARQRAGSASACGSPIPSINGPTPTCRCTALPASTWSDGRRAILTAITRAEPTGRFTERVGHAVTQLIKKENATLVLDMHEAYPEYPIINMIVAHQRAFEIGTIAALMLQEPRHSDGHHGIAGKPARIEPSGIRRSHRGLRAPVGNGQRRHGPLSRTHR